MGERQILQGVYPILATCFKPSEEIDFESQARLIEFCIEHGVHGLVTLANASEGHLLSDDEKRELIDFVISHVKNRIPIVVTVNHSSSKAAAELARYAEQRGAAAVMSLPPFFGRWRPGLDEIFSYFKALNDAVEIPIVVQDHMLTDIQMPISFLIELGKKLPNIRYVKLESGNINYKAKTLTEAEDNPYLSIFGGNSGVFFPEEYDSGCRGTMPTCYMPDIFRKTWDLMEDGNMEEAVRFITPYSRLAAYEKDVSNRCVWKRILVNRGVIASDSIRGPAPSFADEWQIGQLLKVAKRAGLKMKL